MTPPRRSRVNPAATLAILAALLCWSSAPIFIKLLTGMVDSWTQNVLRYATACVFWLPFLVWSIRTGRFRRHIWLLALVPAVPNVILQALWAAAFYYVDPAFMDLLVKSSFFWIAALSLILFRQERALVHSRRFWLGMFLGITGVVGVIVCDPKFQTPRITAGTALALLAGFGWALYAISVRIVFRRVDSRVGFSVISLYTTVSLVLLALVFGDLSACLRMPAKGWVWVVVSGITGIALSHVLFYSAIKRIGATIPSLVLLATPVFVLGMSSIVIGEEFTLLQGLSGLVLLCGAGQAIWAQEHLAPDAE